MSLAQVASIPPHGSDLNEKVIRHKPTASLRNVKSTVEHLFSHNLLITV